MWRREGPAIRELPIRDGWNVLDDNLLACSDPHIRAVFAMLARQPQRPEFTGGLEAARLRPWHAEALRALHPESVFFAYDTPDDLEPLRQAGKMLRACGFSHCSHRLRCYVLAGHPGDTIEQATTRCREAIQAGFFPMAMAYRNEAGAITKEWSRFQRHWTRPHIVASEVRQMRQWEA